MYETVLEVPGILAQQNQTIFIVGLALAFIAFMFIAGRGQRKEKQAREQMLTALSRNDRIVTRGGMIGVIADVKDDEIVVKVDENTNTKVRMKKWAVAGLLNKDKESAEQ